jgi:hypothetical protein
LRAWASGLVATRGLEFGFVPAPDLGPSFDQSNNDSPP